MNMNMTEKKIEHKIQKCQSCYPKLISPENQSPEKKSSKLESLRILNFIYSFLVAIVGAFATKKYTKYYKLIGALIGLLFFYINKKLLTSSEDE